MGKHHQPLRYFQSGGSSLYSAPPLLSLWGMFPTPALKLSTCKRYVGIRREINIWSLALEKQLERS